MLDGRQQRATSGTSRRSRERPVRFCEKLGVKFPGPTRRRPREGYFGGGGLVPAFLLLWAARARSEAGVFIGGSMVVIGLVINRWNTTLVGLLTPLTTNPALTYPVTPSYTPAWMEWAAVIGILSGVLLVFTLGMRTLPVFGPEQALAESPGHAAGD